jgi:hypothetical protein
MLQSVIRRCWHALVRDLLSLGYRVIDMFTERLTWAELISVVVAAPPSSPIRWFLDGGWSRESHLLASMVEGQQGIAQLQQPFVRPGLDYRQQAPSDNRMAADAYTWSEFDELERKKYSEEGQRMAKAGRSGGRVL